MEYTWNGKEPLVLKSGEQRLFLEDGDVIEMRGFAGEGEYVIIVFQKSCWIWKLQRKDFTSYR